MAVDTSSNYSECLLRNRICLVSTTATATAMVPGTQQVIPSHNIRIRPDQCDKRFSFFLFPASGGLRATVRGGSKVGR